MADLKEEGVSHFFLNFSFNLHFFDKRFYVTFSLVIYMHYGPRTLRKQHAEGDDSISITNLIMTLGFTLL